MTDIVERLREIGRFLPFAEEAETVMKAADEIERLRELRATDLELREADRAEIERLRGELHSVHAHMNHLRRVRGDEIERLRAVIIRAKDALLDGQSTQYVHDMLVDAVLGRKP